MPRKISVARDADLVGWIIAQQYAPGTGLPSERDLAERFQITRTQVRQVLLALERDGELVRSRGQWQVPSEHRSEDLSGAIVVVTVTGSAPRGDESLRPNDQRLVWRGMSARAQAEGYRLCTVRCADADRSLVSRFRRQRPAGIVIMGDAVRAGEALPFVQATWPLEIPTCVLGDWITPQTEASWPVDLVLTDQAAGAVALVGWLADHGCRAPVQVAWRSVRADPPSLWWEARCAGYQAGCLQRHLVPRPLVTVVEHPDFQHDAQGIERQAALLAGALLAPLTDGADGLLLPADGPAMQVGNALALLGRWGRVPTVQITGFDNTASQYDPVFARACIGWVGATWDKQEEALGERVVDLVCGRQRGGGVAPPRREVVPGRLVCAPTRPNGCDQRIVSK